MIPEQRWRIEDMPDHSGRIAVVAVANSGLELEAARRLALSGATMVMACRNITNGEDAADAIRRDHAEADSRVLSLDLADLSSVETLTKTFAKAYDRLDIRANNAGVMALPERRTADGFEMQVGAPTILAISP